MLGLRFEDASPLLASDPNRTDIACFVGLTGRRETPVPAAIGRWLAARNYAVDATLLDVPVPIDSWEVFDQLFAWESRPLTAAGQATATTYLGAAVRSFFAQGGRKCYIVRVGDPGPLVPAAPLDADARAARLEPLAPGVSVGLLDASPVDQAGWRGIAHLFGLDDVSFLCLPDLPELVGRQPDPPAVEIVLPRPPERFVACAPGETVASDLAGQRFQAPRCDDDGFTLWTGAVALVAETLRRYVREVQLVAAVPLPDDGLAPAGSLLPFLEADGPLGAGRETAFTQLVYPWARTPGSPNLPEGLEPPDALLCGLLAGSALRRGAFRSAAGLPLGDVSGLYPELAPETRLAGELGALVLQQRVSLLGPTPAGLQLLSDVTTSPRTDLRPAAVNRLLSLLVRAGRLLGRGLTFEPANEALWTQVRDHYERLLTRLYRAGALRGATATAAFQVTCDRRTMSQHDIDNGRVIVEITVNPAVPVEAITVALALDEGGTVSINQ